MAEIQPFRGVRYNQLLVKDAGMVMCPPHDVIPPPLQDELYRRNEYNFVRVEFGRDLPDTNDDNRYIRAAAILEQWLKQGVLQKDAEPCIYVHDFHFNYKGKNYKRRGLIVRVKLEEWSRRIIFPHENTLSKSKSDRLSILWSCQANTSPILAMFQDGSGEISAVIKRETAKKPVIETRNTAGHSGEEKHVVWAIKTPEILNSICSLFADKSLYIADGHHRYESALTYKHEKESMAPPTGNEGYNFVMMTLVEFNDPGLLIMPPHRLVGGMSKAALNTLRKELGDFFNITEFSINDKEVWQKVDGLLTGGLELVRLGFFGLDEGKLQILELAHQELANSLMPAFHSDIYKKLDVSITDHVILEKLLNIAGEQTTLTFTYDKREAVSRVQSGEFQLAVLLNPVKAEVIKAIADAGDRMPRKSTYFYPKEPAGLVFNRLV